jgi:D-amino peptidase
MKVYVSADIEGVAAITAPDEANPTHKDIGWYKEQMTREVKAACDGALAAGATELLVKDAHWTGRNIDPRQLPHAARIVRGWTGHPFSMMAELDQSFGAVVYVGYHARAGSGGNPLAHTMSGGVVAEMRVNDKPVSEFLVNTYTATLVGVPVAFLSGDKALCDEVAAFDSGIATVATFEGRGNGTISIHPDVAIRLIQDGVKEALGGDARKELKRRMKPLPSRFKFEIDYKSPREAYGKSFYPGAKLEGEATVVYEATDWMDVLRALKFCV